MKYKLKLEHALYFLGVVALVAIIGLFIYPKLKAEGSTAVTSTVYTVVTLGDGTGTISGIPVGTLYTDFSGNLTQVDPGSTLTFDEALTHLSVQTGDTLTVTEAGESATVYTMTVGSDLSDDATVSSTVYTISPRMFGGWPIRGMYDITNVPFGTSQATFLSNLTANGPDQTRDVSALADPIDNERNELIVTAQDGMTTATYDITVNEREVSSDTSISSAVYTVHSYERGGTIVNVPSGTSKETFLANLVAQAGQTWNDSAIANPVVTDNSLVVTAEDGRTQYTYVVTVNGPVAHLSGISGGYPNGNIPSSAVNSTASIVAKISSFTGNPIIIPTSAVAVSFIATNSPKDIIKNLQTALNNISLLKLAIDGKLGAKTKSVIINYQKASGLKPDGVVGPKTLDKLIKDKLIKFED